VLEDLYGHITFFGDKCEPGGNDYPIVAELEKQFEDLELQATASGGANNEVFITIPGVSERIIIDANNYTDSGQRNQKEKLRQFLRKAIKQLSLEQKLNLEADPQRGRTSGYN